MASEYGWIRAGFSDIRAGIVTWPVAAAWQEFTPAQQERLQAVFGNPNPMAADLSCGEIYKYVFATNKGSSQWSTKNKLSIKRLSVRGNQSVAEVMDMISSYKNI
jgi:hypothetical protein